MEVRNYLPENHPYKDGKTKVQWAAEGRMVNRNALGEKLWHNRFCQSSGIYYRKEDTHPANAEEIREWKEEKCRAARERYAKRKAKKEHLKREEAERATSLEKARIKEAERKKRFLGIGRDKILCLDIETTGLCKGEDEILQLSIIDGNGEVLFNEYVRPKVVEEWPETQYIHGISPQTVADKKYMDAYIPFINKLLDEAELLIGYNVLQFDLEFLRYAGIAVPEYIEVYDVMLEFAPIYGEWSERDRKYKWQKLSTCASFYGFEGKGGYHNSLEDVKATLHCFWKMIETNNERI